MNNTIFASAYSADEIRSLLYESNISLFGFSPVLTLSLMFILAFTLLKLIAVIIDKKKRKPFSAFISSCVNWLFLIFALVFFPMLFPYSDFIYKTLFTLGNADISLVLLFIVILIVVFAYKTAAFIKKYLLPKAYAKYQLETATQHTFSSVFQYLVILIAFLLCLNTLGVNLNSLTIFAGVFGVGLGFGMQNVVSNFISGVILLFERPIKVGDRVNLNGIIGEIVNVKIRATIVRTVDNEHVIVPNSFFLQEKIINRSYGDLRIRKSIDVGVSYSSDARKVEELLLEAARSVSDQTGNILLQPEPFVRFLEFGDSSLIFKLFIWIDRPENEFLVRSELHYKILEIFRENGIEIPFPQRDIHFKSGSKETL